ncbi:hypothetical protein ACKI1Q_42685 [Streptomyces galilaeus]|uniref:hypothetical protein n=1 Tax=Streptomyces galilaeus TaxID=33899 RepID=UPI0038F782B6
MAEGKMADTGQGARPARLSVVSTATNGIRVLTLAGEIDYDSGQTLRQALEASTTTSVPYGSCGTSSPPERETGARLPV